MPNQATIAGPLQSDLLSGNKRLQNCAQSDPSHVMPNEPASDHVRLIQEALRQVDNADIPCGETNYGEKTIAAVVKFKTANDLFTRCTRTIDPIVGIRTITTLDERMQQVEARRKRAAPTPNVPRISLSGRCQLIGQRLDNTGADDMKFADGFAARKTATTHMITAPLVAVPDDLLEIAMRSSMSIAVSRASGPTTSAAVRAQGMRMVEHFFSGGGAQRDFDKHSDVADEATRDVGFLEFVSRVKFEVDRAVNAAWRSGSIDDRAISVALRPRLDAASFGTGKFSGALTAYIGGFQGYRVRMCGLSVDTAAKTFAYMLDVEVFDHFGVDDSDISRGGGAMDIPIGSAMAAFFLLQHDRSGGPINRVRRKYRPFRLTLRTDVGPLKGFIIDRR
jgi:hypothetical protein